MMKLYVQKQLYPALSVYIGHMLIGFGVMWVIICGTPIVDQSYLPDIVKTRKNNAIVHIYNSALVIGPFIACFLLNSRGRKLCFHIGGIFSFFAFIVLMIASDIRIMYGGQILLGLGTGFIYVTSFVYLGEVASKNIRGTILTATAVGYTLGMLLGFTIAVVSFYITCSIGMFLSGVFVLTAFYTPESPIFLTMKGDDERIKKSLTALGRKEEIDKMLAKCAELAAVEKRKRDHWLDLFRVRSNRRALKITLTLGLLQQIGGLISTEFYGTVVYFFIDGFNVIESDMVLFINGGSKILASILAALFVDKIGRKSLMMISTSSCALSLAILGVVFFIDYLNAPYKTIPIWIPVIVISNYFLSYEVGFASIPQTLVGEVFSTSSRSTGATFVLSISIICGRGFAYSFHYLMYTFNTYVLFWIFSVVCAGGFLFTILSVPETNGKSLPEIEDMLDKDDR